MRIVIKLMEFLLNLIYLLIKIITPVREKITFISRQGNTPSLDFQLLSEELTDRGICTVVLCKILDKSVAGLFSYGFHMIKQMWYMAGSKVVILDGYCIAASMLKHKKSLTIVQSWHSMGSMKDFGYTAMGKEEGSSYKLAKAMKMHQNYDYVLISSEAYKMDMAAGFRCDENKIYVRPLPRLDLLTSASYEKQECAKIYRKYPELKEKKNILYCPTFRKGDESGLKQALEDLVCAVDKQKYNLIVKLHPLSELALKESQVCQAKEFTTFDMLFVADYVISDYSCVVYEAAVRGIPLYFLAFDLELYEGNRGLAIDYEKECPGLISERAEEIIREIEEGSYDRRALKQFADKYVQPTEHATADMADFILGVMNGRVE